MRRGTSLAAAAAIASSIKEMILAPFASMATDMTMNHSSSLVPVNDVKRERLSGSVMSASGTVV